MDINRGSLGFALLVAIFPSLVCVCVCVRACVRACARMRVSVMDALLFLISNLKCSDKIQKVTQLIYFHC